MLAYKPKEDPFLIKIAKSGTFQFLMVVLLGIGVTYFVVRTDQPQQWIQKINRFASVAPNPKAKTEAGIAEDQAEFEAPPPQANTWAARATSPTSEMAATTASATAAGAAPQAQAFKAGTGDASPTQTVSAPVKLIVRMVEIDHDHLNALMTGGAETRLTGDITAYRTYSNAAIDASYTRPLRSDTLDFTTAKNALVTVGNNSRWIRLSFNVLDIQGSSKFFDLVIVKNHPNENLQIPIDLTLRAGEKFIIAGNSLITYFDIDNDLASVAPFTIFKSTDYRNQKTTFAIIIDLQ